MVTFNIYFVFILGFIATKNIDALETCAISNAPKCSEDDMACVKTTLMPWMHEWMRHGQDEYLVKALNTIILEDVSVNTEKGEYHLTKVELTGFADANLTDIAFDQGKGKIDYTHEFNLELVADHFVDENGKNLVQQPLIVQFDNLRTHTSTKVKTHTRCNLKKHFEIIKTSVEVYDINEGDVVFKQGMEKPTDKLIQSLAKAVAEAAARTLVENYRNIDIIFPITKFLN